MTKLIIIISFLLFLDSPFANAEQVYYCTSELATGVIKRNGNWETGNFKEKRYTIKFNDYYTKLEGLDDSTWNCVKPYSWVTKMSENMIVCYYPNNNGEIFSFHINTLRFLHVLGSIFGYVENHPNADTNAMVAGTCQKF